MQKRNLNKVAKHKMAVEKFNEELAEYVKLTGDNLLPDIETTCFGFSELEPVVVSEIENGFACDYDGLVYEVKIAYDEDGEEYVDGWDMSYEHPYDLLKDALAYDRRRMRKGIRIYMSENPDAELEKDEEE